MKFFRCCGIIVLFFVLVFVVAWIVLGGGPSPLDLAVQPQRDVLVHIPDGLKLADTVSYFAERSDLFSEEQRRTLQTCRSGSYRALAWLFLPTMETALSLDVPNDDHPDGSGVAAFRYGRTGRVVTRFVTGGKNPYQEEPDGPKFWRFGSAGALQWGETYEIKPSPGESPFSGKSDYLAAGLIYPERVENRIGKSFANYMDMMRIPWPLTRLDMTLSGEPADGYVVNASAAYSPGTLRKLPAAAVQAGPQPSLADRFINENTVFAAGWLAPLGSEIPDMLTEFAPDSAALATQYRYGVANFASGIRNSLGPRAALVIYRQPDVRMKPGYAGVVFAQELSKPDTVSSILPGLLNSISRGIVEEGEAPPADYPYFVHQSPAPELPAAYIYNHLETRSAEGYQPLILVHDGLLIYASSPAVLGQALAGIKSDPEKVFVSVYFCNTDDLGWEQVRRIYEYMVQEWLVTLTGEQVFSEKTDFARAFSDARSILSQFKFIDVSTTGTSGEYTATARLMLPDGK
ncbi:MAG: hypothetical protein JW909_11040 [Planctomycetes bacterium]|nr:hypothetical protein [Planctomycetota bacterium]